MRFYTREIPNKSLTMPDLSICTYTEWGYWILLNKKLIFMSWEATLVAILEVPVILKNCQEPNALNPKSRALIRFKSFLNARKRKMVHYVYLQYLTPLNLVCPAWQFQNFYRPHIYVNKNNKLSSLA